MTSLERSQKRVSCSKSAAGLLLAVIKPISGCVGIACSGLILTSLLQVVNRLAACQLIVKTFYPQAGGKLFDNSQQACKYQDATSLIFTDLLPLYEVNRLATTC